MAKNPKPHTLKVFWGLLLILCPYMMFLEPLKSLRPFKMAKMRYLGRIKARQRTQKWLKTLKPPMPKVFCGLLFIIDFIPIYDLFEPLKSLRPFKRAKMRYLGRIKLPEGPKNGQKPYSPLPQTFFMGYYCFMPLY